MAPNSPDAASAMREFFETACYVGDGVHGNRSEYSPKSSIPSCPPLKIGPVTMTSEQRSATPAPVAPRFARSDQPSAVPQCRTTEVQGEVI